MNPNDGKRSASAAPSPAQGKAPPHWSSSLPASRDGAIRERAPAGLPAAGCRWYRAGLMSPRRRRRRSTPTPAQIWRILRAAARETRIAKREAQTARREAEIARRELTTLERQIREEDRKRKEEQATRDKEQAALEKERAARQKEWAERQAARNVRVEKEIFRILGDGDNRWGMLVEALVEGNLLKILRDAGIEVDDATARRRSLRSGIWREYDLVAVGERDAVVVEVKTTLRLADVARFTERIGDFRHWRSDDARERVWGALAYLGVEGNAARAAEEAGFYLLRAVSGSARLVNSEGFAPRRF